MHESLRKRHNRSKAGTLVSLCLLLAIAVPWLAGTAKVSADQPVIWSKPVNLSQSDESSVHPAIVADSMGNIHLFWSEEVGGEPMLQDEMARPGNTILYTRWDGQSWIEPRDVLYVRGEYLGDYVSVAIDDNNRLHAVWTGLDNIYYSSAPAAVAETAQSWSKPVVVGTGSARSAFESAVAVDSQGVIHVAYGARRDVPGVNYVQSSNGGETWSAPVTLSLPLDRLESGYSQVRLVVDSADRIHATWTTFQRQGFGQGVYHSRSTDGGLTWNTPYRLAYREDDDIFVEWPYLTEFADQELRVIFTDGDGKGRLQRISTDGGETWGEPTVILTELEGINGYIISLLDAAEQPHLIANMRTRSDGTVGLFYAPGAGGGWQPTVPIATDLPYGPSSHYPAAAVRLGNEIHIVWTQLRRGEIWHMKGEVSGVEPLPVMERLPPQEVVQPSPTISISTPTPEPLETVAPSRERGVAGPTPAPVAPPSPLGAVLPGITLSLLLVLGVIVWKGVRAR
ncbi:MAG: exo-alpha-sialidase [Chloroflexota bacterium]|nr:exo-alpha-sialidase [Chloroflexota bacterium]